MAVVSITFPGQPEHYESFTLHQGVSVVVRRTDTGEEGILSSLDVFIEQSSGWRLPNHDEL